MTLAQAFGPFAGLHIDDPKCMQRMMRAIGFRKTSKDKGNVVPPTHRLEKALSNMERALVDRIMQQMGSNELLCEIITKWFLRYNDSDAVIVQASIEVDKYLTYGALNPNIAFLHQQARDNWNARPNKKLGIIKGGGKVRGSSAVKKGSLGPATANSLSQVDTDRLRRPNALNNDELNSRRLQAISEKYKLGPLVTWFKERLPVDVGSESHGPGRSLARKRGVERHPTGDSEDDDDSDEDSEYSNSLSNIEGFVRFEDDDEEAGDGDGDGNSEEQKAAQQKKKLNMSKHRPQKDRRSWIVDIDTIDRSKCVVGKPEPEKLKIAFRTLTEDLDHEGQIKDGRIARYRFMQEVDWHDELSVSKLNYWRNQLFNRRLGPEVGWLVTEQNLAFQQFLKQLSYPEVCGSFSKVNWEEICQNFNAATAGTVQRAGEPLVPIQKTPPSHLPRLSANRPAPRRKPGAIKAQLSNWDRPDIKEAVKQSKTVAGLPLGKSGIKVQSNPFDKTAISKGRGQGNAAMIPSPPGNGKGKAKATPSSADEYDEDGDTEFSQPSVFNWDRDESIFGNAERQAAFNLAVIAASHQRDPAETATSKPLHTSVAALKGRGHAQVAGASKGKGKAIAPEDDLDSDDFRVPSRTMYDYGSDEWEEEERLQLAWSYPHAQSPEALAKVDDYELADEEEEESVQEALRASRSDRARPNAQARAEELQNEYIVIDDDDEEVLQEVLHISRNYDTRAGAGAGAGASTSGSQPKSNYTFDDVEEEEIIQRPSHASRNDGSRARARAGAGAHTKSQYTLEDDEEEVLQEAMQVSSEDHARSEAKKRKRHAEMVDSEEEEESVRRVLEASRREHAAVDPRKKRGESSSSNRRQY
ncbi:hypothetical protein B7494_g2791 [Chlorociboria aeruginascens]|nr:hypothetical protein B7494_g2791 [Chlorociboria aeruginascens]